MLPTTSSGAVDPPAPLRLLLPAAAGEGPPGRRSLPLPPSLPAKLNIQPCQAAQADSVVLFVIFQVNTALGQGTGTPAILYIFITYMKKISTADSLDSDIPVERPQGLDLGMSMLIHVTLTPAAFHFFLLAK